MNKQTLELKTFLHRKIPSNNYFIIKRANEKIEHNREFKIKDDKEYFYWLGEVSALICNNAPNVKSKKFMTHAVHMNCKYDLSILSTIKLILRFSNDFNELNDEEIRNFLKIFESIISYRLKQNKLLFNDNVHFLKGFYSKTEF